MRGLILVLWMTGQVCFGQNFVRVTDSNNPIVTEPGPAGYAGCAWVDYDNDGDEDLLSNPNRLYRNDGGGNFSAVANAFLSASGVGTGCSWADVDNDGDLDVMIAGTPCTLYRNHHGNFAPDSSGDIARSAQNRGWSPAFGDYNNDGAIDLIITHPAGFSGPAQHNHVFRNGGPPDYQFSRDTTTHVSDGLEPFTVGTWSDFDLDGDYDYFIGAGPAGPQPGPDFIYRNMLVESGIATLVRDTTGPIAETLRDGQVYNWIDYDNDRDLDCYITNWGGAISNGLQNELYRNDGGTLTRITEGAIVTDDDISLANLWADFDNDGDQDCYVTNDNQVARYYNNNGDGTFTRQTNNATITGFHRGCSAADYDIDGDLDLFVNGVGAAKRLFRNDLANGYHWVRFHCEGAVSNRAAIGTKIHVKATINGQSVWQLREISAQNSFSSHNSLIQHFGLRDAVSIDSVMVVWPGSVPQYFVNLTSNQMYYFVEGENTDVDERSVRTAEEFSLFECFPNPFNSSSEIRFELKNGGAVRLAVYDTLGREVVVLREENFTPGLHRISFDGRDLSSGSYQVRLTMSHQSESRKVILLK